MLERHVNQSAGVYHVIRCVQDAATFQLVGNIQMGQLIVRRTGHCRAAQLRHAVAVEHPAQTAWRKNIARRAEQCVVGDGVSPELLHCQLHLAVIDIADQQFGPGSVQLFCQGITNVAQALNGNAQAFEVIAAQSRHRSGANAGEYAHRRVWRRVARRGGAGDMLGLLGDAIHVRH
ncbi:hypothetical protein D3C86_1564560 [compost metagenome]